MGFDRKSPADLARRLGMRRDRPQAGEARRQSDTWRRETFTLPRDEAMPRIIYLFPSDDAPTGGIKVIYRHAELLADMGVDASVLHPFDLSFRCTWFDHRTRLLDSMALDPGGDFVVIPELWAPMFGPQCRAQGVRYGIFVQNGYITHPVLPDHPAELHDEAYLRADLVLSISDDTAEMVKLNFPGLDPDRMVRVRCSVPRSFLAVTPPTGRERVITYMPRKMAAHSVRVVKALERNLPAPWRLVPIHNVDEATCAAMLHASQIFLSFSEFEGLGLPPLEAALAGNRVVGYTGQGAREYWHRPIFEEVHQGDVIGFVKAALAAVQLLDHDEADRAALGPERDGLAEQFSAAAELSSLDALKHRISGCFTGR